MSAYAGLLVPVSTPHVALDRIPLVLFVGALVVALSSNRLEGPRRHAVSLVSIGLSLGLLAVHAVQLFMLEPSRRALRDVTTNLIRIGSFDANLGFFLDAFAAVLLFVVLGASAFFLARVKFVEKNEASAARFHSSVLLLGGGVSLAVMADGFVGLLLGLSLSIVSTYLLILRDEQLSSSVSTAGRVFLLQSVGSASLFTACVLIFWSLGGAWRDDGYQNDYRARFVSVHTPGHLPTNENVVMPAEAPRGERDASALAQRAKEKGTLTFTSHPGTRVFIDAGDKLLDKAESFGETPFVRKEISAGPHDVVIVPGGAAIITGDGHETAWIERLDVSAGEDVAIVPLGQTSTFSEVDDQLGLIDADGKHFLRNAFFNRSVLGSFNVVSVVVFLAALGVFLLGAPLFLAPWFGRVESTPTWNILRIAALVLALHPLARLETFVSFRLPILGGVFVVAALLVALARSRRPALILGAATIALLVLPRVARADESAARMVLRPEFGDVVELQYAPDGETMNAAFVIRNEGSAPLMVTRAHLVHSDAVPRLPPFVSAEIDGAKGEPVVIEPGKQRRVIVRWKYAATRARELFGLAWVETNASRESAYVPVHAARPRDLGPFGDHALSFLVGFPLLAALLALILRLVRRDDPRFLAGASALVFGGHLAFVLAVIVRFDERLARADGNDGLQFIEHSVLFPNLGVEWFLGVDGLSLTLVALTSIAALLAALASFSAKERTLSFHAIAPVLVSALIGVFLAQDLFLFCIFWLLSSAAVTALIVYGTDKPARRMALGFGAITLASALFLAAAANWLHQHSHPTYLVNGHFMVTAWSFPELSRVDWIDRALEPTPLILVWSALFIAFVAQLVSLGSVFAFSSSPTNHIVPTAWAGTAIYGLLRLNIGIMPFGMNWAATTVIIVGIAMIFTFTWLAWRQTNLKIFVAFLSVAFTGFALVGIGSRTPQGMTAAICILLSVLLGLMMFAVLFKSLETRTESLDMKNLDGLSSKMPLFSAGFLIAGFLLTGLPGLAGFWGALLAVVGVFPRQPIFAIVAIIALVFLGGTHIRVAGHVLFGAAPEPSEKKRWSDLGRDELLVLIPCVLFAIGLGFSPRTLLSLLDAVILDLHRLVDAAGSMQIG